MLTRLPARLCAALFVGVLLAVSSGCGGGGAPSTAAHPRLPLPADTMTVPAREIGRYGGRFVLGQTSSPKTFNPYTASGSSTTDVTTLLYSSLVDIDYHTLADVGQLAKSWDVSDDHLAYTFHLRRGAKFSDGHPITSEDVQFSFDVMLDDSLDLSGRRLLMIGDREYTVSSPDSYTVVIRLPEVYATALANIGSVRILPKHRLETAYREGRFTSAYGTDTPPESLVTSGPWRIGEFVVDQRTVLAPNPNWYGVDAKGQRLPYLDQLVFLIGKDQATIALRFHAGELDGVDNVKPEDYPDYEAKQKAEAFTLHDLGPSLNTNFLFFNLNLAKETGKGRRAGAPVVGATKYGWFVNPVFRRAMSKAVDRAAIIKGPYYGYGISNFSLFTVANKLWHCEDVRKDDYDPAGAKALLASLGMRDANGDGILEDAKGNRVEFVIKTNSDNNLRMSMASLLQEDLRKVGVDAKVQGVDFRALTSNLQDDFQYEACLLGLQTSIPPDPGLAGSVLRSDGSHHYWAPRQKTPTLEVDRQLDDLFRRVNATTVYAERKQAADAIQRTLNEQCMMVWLPTLETRIPVRDRFGNIDPSIMPHRILWNSDRIFEKAPAGGR